MTDDNHDLRLHARLLQTINCAAEGMADAAYRIVTLKRALGRHGCRMGADSGGGPFKHGIMAASFAADAAEPAGAVLDRHRLAQSDRVVAWAPPGGASGAVVEQRAWQA
jgi:hypothetical protein